MFLNLSEKIFSYKQRQQTKKKKTFFLEENFEYMLLRLDRNRIFPEFTENSIGNYNKDITISLLQLYQRPSHRKSCVSMRFMRHIPTLILSAYLQGHRRVYYIYGKNIKMINT